MEKKNADTPAFNHWLLRVAAGLQGGMFDGLAFRLLCHLKGRRAAIKNVDYLRARSRLLHGSAAEAMVMLREELRYFPDNRDARILLSELEGSQPAPPEIPDPDLSEIYPLIAPFTMLGVDRLRALLQAARLICEEDKPGNFVECGVAAGGSSVLLAWAIKRYSKRPRRLFAADSFQGLPSPRSIDTHAGKGAASLGWGRGTCAAPRESLSALASKAGVADIVVPVEGFFHETLPTAKKEFGQIALLHMDGDWYESTWTIFSHLYPLCVPGAYVQLDDYHYWDGCRTATDDYQAQTGERFEINSIDASGAYFWKSPTPLPADTASA